MENALARAARYRTKAHEARIIAETNKDLATKEMLVGVAADYLHMADALERMEARNAPRAPAKPVRAPALGSWRVADTGNG